MAYDNICKYLAERFPEQFARWLMGEVALPVQLLPTELSEEPMRADSVILLGLQQGILHLEFQTDPDPEIPFRMADYRLRLYRKYPQLSVRQVVIYLRKTRSQRVFQTSFRLERLSHEFEVVRLWECNLPARVDWPALLPFRVLSQVEDPGETLREVVAELERLPESSEQRELAAATAVLAGLALDRGLIRQIMRSLDMRESVIYQEWRAEALREGLEAGRKEGLQLGLQQGLQHGEATLVLRLLRRKLGSLDPALENQIWALPPSQLEALGEALLDFHSVEDLTAWLARR
ncbi:Rpn family recombination-promoting nuclease/putative transposase [Synechococcus sp. H55.10]|uniref:Rpn family recombination-promoting nuclease/putative transposase n=1 Tax=Synechococcus sp. H55.10 TaxID=2964503 RepID=UPI0039C6970D